MAKPRVSGDSRAYPIDGNSVTLEDDGAWRQRAARSCSHTAPDVRRRSHRAPAAPRQTQRHRDVSVELPELVVADRAEWRTWLADHHDDLSGVWLVLAKKDTMQPTSLSYDQALDEALCHGWIDGQVRRRDEFTYAQRFTPRRAKSAWSKRNVGIVERLLREDRMHPAGLAQVARAKADGRWRQPTPGRPRSTCRTISGRRWPRSRAHGPCSRLSPARTATPSSTGFMASSGLIRGRDVSSSTWPCSPAARRSTRSGADLADERRAQAHPGPAPAVSAQRAITVKKSRR